ncbi:MAG: SGNH/GDSL hydrolase family protein [Hyphomonas sp.]
MRIRFSNEFGEGPLAIGAASAGRSAGSGRSAIAPASAVALSFAGSPSVTIPEGAAWYSDPLGFNLAAGEDVAVTFHIVSASSRQTGHPGSRTTSYFTSGNLVFAEDLPGAERLDHWYVVSGIDAVSDRMRESVGVIGDSITDGRGSTTNGNDRWTDFLADRLGSKGVSVLNFGLGGNRVLKDGLGPNALARFDRDILAQPGLRYVIVYEGINDLGTLTRKGAVAPEVHQALVHDLEAAYTQMVERAHAHGISAIGATIAPYRGNQFYSFDPATEQDRQEVNVWIRSSGVFDAVLDFDRVLRDPDNPDRLSPEFDSGDGLHPSPAGFAEMAASVPLDLFADAEPCR